MYQQCISQTFYFLASFLPLHSFTRRYLLMRVMNLVVMKDLSMILFEILPLKLQPLSLPYTAVYGSQITVGPLLCFLLTPALLPLFEQIPPGFWTSEQALMFSESNIPQEVTISVCALRTTLPHLLCEWAQVWSQSFTCSVSCSLAQLSAIIWDVQHSNSLFFFIGVVW